MNDPIPDRVLNFGSSEPREDEEGGITPETLDAHVDKRPRPTGYRVLILPFKTQATTKGGIMLAKQTMDKEHLATVVGLVVALGPDAYNDSQKFPNGPWCNEKDWVLIGRYAGNRFKVEGLEVRIINDDNIIATILDPKDISYV